MKIIVNENQLKKLILFNLNEQKETINTKFDTIRLGDYFDFGKYESKDVYNEIKKLRKKIDGFIKLNNESSFLFKVVAGESKVTNPKGFETKGSLGLARAKEVGKYVSELFSDLIKEKKVIIDIPQTTSEIKIGTTPYGGPGSNDHKNPVLVSKYRQEQFVNIEISGNGSKTIDKTPPTKNEEPSYELCKTPVLKSEGQYISSRLGFMSRTKYELGKGSGQVYFYSETYDMPDIIYLEYNGKSYGSTNFSGTDAPWTRLLIGTALINKYGVGGKLPAEYGSTTFEQIKSDDPTFKTALMEARSNNWGLQRSFVNIFGQGEELENEQYMNAFGLFDQQGSVKNLLKSLGPNFVWGRLTSKITPSLQKNIKFQKSEHINDAVIVNIAPNGGTNWNIGITCKPF